MCRILFQGKLAGRPNHYRVILKDNSNLELREYDTDYINPWMPVYSSNTAIELLEKVIHLLLNKE